MALLDAFRKREREDVRIDLPGVEIVFNHRLKIAFVYTADSNTKDETYADLEKHLLSKRYLLVVIVAPIGLPMSPRFNADQASA